MSLVRSGVFTFFLWMAVFLLFPSCVLEKRLYRPGYHTDWISHRQYEGKIKESGGTQCEPQGAKLITSLSVQPEFEADTIVKLNNADSLLTTESFPLPVDLSAAISLSEIFFPKQFHLTPISLLKSELMQNGDKDEKRLLPKILIIGGLVILVVGLILLLGEISGGALLLSLGLFFAIAGLATRKKLPKQTDGKNEPQKDAKGGGIVVSAMALFMLVLAISVAIVVTVFIAFTEAFGI